MLVATLVALGHVAAEDLGSTGDKIAQGTRMARWHALTVQGEILGTEGADNLRQIRHANGSGLQLVHQVVE
jgi:hypothetical protein